MFLICRLALLLPALLHAQSALAQTYTLSVSTAGGNGAGAVNISGSPTPCASACSTPLAAGTIVQLAAIGSPGSSFAGWSGVCT